MATRFSALIGCLIGVLGGVQIARAAEVVSFDSAAAQPTPFQLRLARERGKAAIVEPGTPLRGYLTKPRGEGPFPAVVMLHGCAGISRRDETWSERLSSWGYVVLAVDSFTTRGIDNTCRRLFYDRVNDAFGALEFLSKQSFVDRGRVAVLGFSAGGIAALQAAQPETAQLSGRPGFSAAIAYYPSCSISKGEMATPTLVLIGELDDWSSAAECREMMAKRSGKGAHVRLIVYEGAHHRFDTETLKTGVSTFGHFMQYHEAAAKQSIRETHLFLRQAFGR